MSSIDPPPAPDGGIDGRRPPLARLVGRRPDQGAAVAAKVVAEDLQRLIKAEIALAKAEVASGLKSKVTGAGLFIGVAVIGWLAIQVFLVFLGFLFALFLPGWAAVGLVLLLLVIAMGALGYVGYRKFQADMSRTRSKASIAESKEATKAAVDRAKAHASEGIAEAKVAVAEATDDLKADLRGQVRS
jgi:Na+-transporting methylmalonyl-CoA/oxaloacetate decarboxylase gamma subunit